ncbi:MAG TPA: 2-hydroxyglutaryl-CoA dehydratase [Dehalococcoidia bacterium]|nr:2-hydroxyglutaryl-CoA dehydratase [Dehalococcoidia bacterium]
MVYVAGIDAGAAFTKAVILGDDAVLASQVVLSTSNYAQAAISALEGALSKAKLERDCLAGVVTTGLAAGRVPFPNERATETSCISTGVHRLFPSARTVIDVGGQASRVIKMDEAGRALSFMINEKCAAGSGRFLQVIARVLQVNLDDIGELSLGSKRRTDFSTSCAVFAESEAITRIAEGASKEDILAGVHHALASKIASMVEAMRLTPDCAMVGGGAKDIGLVRSVEEKLGISLLVPEEPQVIAALGAALIAGGRLASAGAKQG